jgi:hypothetical protein
VSNACVACDLDFDSSRRGDERRGADLYIREEEMIILSRECNSTFLPMDPAEQVYIGSIHPSSFFVLYRVTAINRNPSLFFWWFD